MEHTWRMILMSLAWHVALSVTVCAQEVNFEHDIRPIFKAHCFHCHGQDEHRDGGLDLRLVRFLKTGGESGPAIIPGNPDDSLLLQRVQNHEMPPEGGQPLSPAQISRLKRWLELGAPTIHLEPESVDDSGITPDDRQFWAFQPWTSESTPTPHDPTGIRNFIDAQIRFRLEQMDLPPAEEADRRTILRRLAFHLTGLPPSWEENEAFLTETAPDAVERTTDRLLASPHYGERWARSWLDLARYADQTPFWVVSAERAWLYRDWVIRAFNEDRPYDEFVRLQLAADQLPETPRSEFAALGFLGLSPTYWKELRLSPDVIKTVVAEEWDERIDTISRTFLGLTVSCARCHDHKFDPVTMQDYYALAGVLASTQLVDQPQIPEDAAETVRVARQQVADFERRLSQIKDQDSPEGTQLRQLIARLKSATPHFDLPWVHAVEEMALIVQPEGEDKTRLEYRFGEHRDLPLFRRGNPSQPSPEPISRRFLAVLSHGEPHHFEHGSGRLDLAEAILRDARALSSRVEVNRIWGQHFGKGIVRTTSDFGRQGEPPINAALLDALASGFVAHHWSHKWLQRRIVESATFRQSSRETSTGKERDPDNHYLGRMNRRRLEIEPYRDAVLMVAGQLDDRMYGPSLPFDDPGNDRRTIYGRVVREEQHSMLRLYDFPDASAHSPHREQTTTALQQLFVLNGPLFQNAAASATQIQQSKTPRTLIETCYRQLFQRNPTEQELRLGLNFLSGHADETATRERAYVHALLSSNEFLFLD